MHVDTPRSHTSLPVQPSLTGVNRCWIIAPPSSLHHSIPASPFQYPHPTPSHSSRCAWLPSPLPSHLSVCIVTLIRGRSGNNALVENMSVVIADSLAGAASADNKPVYVFPCHFSFPGLIPVIQLDGKTSLGRQICVPRV